MADVAKILSTPSDASSSVCHVTPAPLSSSIIAPSPKEGLAGPGVTDSLLLASHVEADLKAGSPKISSTEGDIKHSFSLNESRRRSLSGSEEAEFQEMIEQRKRCGVHRTDSLLHLQGTRKKLVLGMVGLPARGKTYIAKKLCRYLNWLSYKTEVFNIGNYRRQRVGAHMESAFFDPSNPEGVKQRTKCAIAALDDMFNFFREGGQAAIYDGTNSTRERREMVMKYIREHSGGMTVELVWIESVCNDEGIIELNIRETKLTSPDYINMDPDEAVADFRNRIALYEKAYETLDQNCSESYIQIIDAGNQLVANRIRGYLPGRIVFFLLNIRINKNAIFLSRHGESEFNRLGKIGGDASLTDKGQEYAHALEKFIEQQPEVHGPEKLSVWCSTLKRTIQTAGELATKYTPVTWRALTEIQVGICEGMTYEEIEEKYPHEFAARHNDKLRYRYPQGESYVDVINRLEPVIFELERIKGPVLVVGHRAVLRCLFAYFLDLPSEKIPYLNVPLHTVLKLVPKAYGCEISRHQLLSSPDDQSEQRLT